MVFLSREKSGNTLSKPPRSRHRNQDSLASPPPSPRFLDFAHKPQNLLATHPQKKRFPPNSAAPSIVRSSPAHGTANNSAGQFDNPPAPSARRHSPPAA